MTICFELSLYDRLFDEFAEYCEVEGLSSLPAATSTVVCYVGYLAELGTWAEARSE